MDAVETRAPDEALAAVPPAHRKPLSSREWLVRVALAAGVLLVGVVSLFVLGLRDFMPTAAQAALGVWGVAGVPVAAALADGGRAPAPRAFYRLLAFGWGGCAVAAAIAITSFPEYPLRGPHEVVAGSILLVAPACLAASILLMAQPRSASVWRPMAAIVVSAILFGLAPWWLFADRIDTALPLTAFPIHRAGRHDFAGTDATFLRVGLEAAEVAAYTSQLGLELNDVAPRPFPFAFEHVRDNWNAAPDAFVPPRGVRSWSDPSDAAHNTNESWCWTEVRWDGTTAWISRGCAWL